MQPTLTEHRSDPATAFEARTTGSGAANVARTIALTPSLQARVLNQVLRHAIKRRATGKTSLAALRRLVRVMDALVLCTGAQRTAACAAGVPIEWISGDVRVANRTVLYLHGGGFMLRSPRIHARLAAQLCNVLGARALMPDYRLAPEHPLPAAHEDCITTYRWLLDHGCDPSGIVVAGDSAGGLLVLATLQRIRDAALPPPRCGVLFSPGGDLANIRKPAAGTDDDPLITPAMLSVLERIVVDPVDATDSRISPCRGNLGGLPPLLIQVGSTEVLLDQSLKVAAAASEQGTRVELQIWPEMPHVFQAATWLPESKRALGMVRDFVDAA
jgi:acetyl esterase/lipase